MDVVAETAGQHPDVGGGYQLAAGESVRKLIYPSQIQELFDNVDDINGSRGLVEKALKLIYSNDNIARLGEEYGFVLPDDYPIAIGCIVAELNLDRIREGETKERTNKAANQERRVISIVTALLQEFVAHNLISMEAIEKEFGKESEHAKLIAELAAISRIPVYIAPPDMQDGYSVRVRSGNQTQDEYAQELLHATKNPARAWHIKAATAWQFMRCVADIDDVELRRKYARHIMGMYWPMVMEASLSYQYAFQDLLLRALDRESYVSIGKQLEEMRAQEKLERVQAKVKVLLERQGFVVLQQGEELTDEQRQKLKISGKVVVRLSGRVKEKWSIWKKLLDKAIRTATELGLATPAERLSAVNITGISDVIGLRASLEAVDKNELEGRFGHNVKISLNGVARAFIKAANRLLEKKFPDHDKHKPLLRRAYRLMFCAKALCLGLEELEKEKTKSKDRKKKRRKKKKRKTTTVEKKDDLDASQEQKSYELCREVNGILADCFGVVKGEYEDYIKKPKSNGYQNIHNVFLDEEEGVSFELQVGTAEMHKNNGDGSAKHSVYKQEHAVHDPKAHPAPSDPLSRDERTAHTCEIIDQMGARAEGRPLPGHQERRFLIVSDCIGILSRLNRGAVLRTLAKKLYPNSHFQDRIYGVAIDGVVYMDSEFYYKLKTPLKNAMVVQFLEYPEPCVRLQNGDLRPNASKSCCDRCYL